MELVALRTFQTVVEEGGILAELRLIANAAIIGDSSQPKAG